MKKVLVILAHPNMESFCGALASAYEGGAREAGHEVRRLNLAQVPFAVAQNAMPDALPLEPAILSARADITWAEHIVIVGPVWWGNWPALATGFFERAFGAGYAMEYDHKGFPRALLSGRTAHVVSTSGAPSFVILIFFRDIPVRIMKSCILGLCGIKAIAVSRFGAFMGKGNTAKRERMLAEMKTAGKNLR